MEIQIAIAGSAESVSATVEAGGRSQKWFDGLTKREQKQYIKENPRSKFNPARKKKAAATKKAPAKAAKAAPKKAAKPMDVDKSKAAMKKLDVRYDKLTARLDKLKATQQVKPTAARKTKIAAITKRLKDLSKEYKKHVKSVNKIQSKQRVKEARADPKRASHLEYVERTARELEAAKARHRPGSLGARKVERAQKKHDNAKAGLEKYDLKKSGNAPKAAKKSHAELAEYWQKKADGAYRRGNEGNYHKLMVKSMEAAVKHHTQTGDKKKLAQAQERLRQHRDPI